MGRRAAEGPLDISSQQSPAAATPIAAAQPNTTDETPLTRRQARERERALGSQAVPAESTGSDAAELSTTAPAVSGMPAIAAPAEPAASAEPVQAEPVAEWSEWTPKAARVERRAAGSALRRAKVPRVELAPRVSVRSRKRAIIQRTAATVAACGALALLPTLMLAAPAANAQSTLTASQQQAQSEKYAHGQTISVAAAVANQQVQTQTYGATAYVPPVTVTAATGASAVSSGSTATATVETPATTAERQTIVSTAESYLGVPYEFGGASYSGIDCSGLSMVSYAAVGISMQHGVSAQDAMATEIPESAAQPGDLVFFDDDEHVAVYIGNNEVIAAPDTGELVQVQNLSDWSSIPYHFGRILPN
jgi:cell wall-associated NlpC family hydrolase